ncbi:MAG: protein translocase subunit SecF, partial [Gammaproteobacteria bacterium]|nr:protein translocase subunit SecF [Gammaproteobacteria bacterium]
MQLFKSPTNFDFMGKRLVAGILSGILIIISLASLAVRSLEFGIDFTGGTLIEVGYSNTIELTGVRTTLASEGFGDAIVQHFGTTKDVLIRIAPRADVSQAELGDRIFQALRQADDQQLSLRRVEFVGPQVGEELTEQGGLAMLIALGAILVYVAIRFEYR